MQTWGDLVGKTVFLPCVDNAGLHPARARHLSAAQLQDERVYHRALAHGHG